jgi:hypothetical protein
VKYDLNYFYFGGIYLEIHHKHIHCQFGLIPIPFGFVEKKVMHVQACKSFGDIMFWRPMAIFHFRINFHLILGNSHLGAFIVGVPQQEP